jgi:HEAT repeat protein
MVLMVFNYAIRKMKYPHPAPPRQREYVMRAISVVILSFFVACTSCSALSFEEARHLLAQSSSREERMPVLRRLSSTDDSRSIDLVIREFRRGDEYSREDAIRTLLSIGDVALPRLEEALKPEANMWEQLGAAVTLVKAKHSEKGRDVLCAALKCKSMGFRIEALKEVEKTFGATIPERIKIRKRGLTAWERELVPPLVDTLRNGNVEVRSRSVRILNMLTDKVSGYDWEGWTEWCNNDILPKIRTSPSRKQRQARRIQLWNERSSTQCEMNAGRPPTAVEKAEIQRLLLNEDKFLFLRRCILDEGIDVRSIIRDGLKSKNAVVRNNCARLTVSFPSREAVPSLILLLDDERTRAFSSKALGVIGDKAATLPIAGLLAKENDWFNASLMIEALEALCDPRSVETLIPLTKVKRKANVADEANRALRVITMKNLRGYSQWSEWFQKHGREYLKRLFGPS